MIIKAVCSLMKRARYMKSVIKKYQAVLASGKYHLFDNFRSVSLKDPMVLSKAEACFPLGTASSLRVKVSNLLNKMNYFSIDCAHSTGEYEAVYAANNFDKVREIKLFSFRNQKILTLCTNCEEMHKQLCEYERFKDAYGMPRVSPNGQFENALDVAMVNRLKFPGDDQALTAIAEATVSYNADADSVVRKPAKELLTFAYDDETMNTYLNMLREDVHADVLSCSMPLCMQHGDLSKDNLIFGESERKNAFWWIDWEHARQRIFFYDYFFYILNSALYNDTGAFDCYISGQNDMVLKRYFSHFGLNFDSSKKWSYFLVFAVEFLKERVCDKGYVSTLVRYCDLIDKLKAANGGAVL